jgi:hypothetical protein
VVLVGHFVSAARRLMRDPLGAQQTAAYWREQISDGKGGSSMSDIAKFTEKTLSRFSKSITDEVFLLIQNDKELMYEYLKLVETHGLATVNQQIGKAVKRRFDLSSDSQREFSPQSTLIQSHQQFE